jgi:hypothetical protein
MSRMSSKRSDLPTVFFHIGPPKTGTTFVQGTLKHWDKDLREIGIVLPGTTRHNHFRAALDARGDHTFGFGAGHDQPRKRTVGAWARLVTKTLAVRDTAIISNELFATADSEHARAAMSDLAETDLHLVVTARDPERQLVSAFQQRIKNGQQHDFQTTASNVRNREALHPSQRLPELLERWGSTLAPDHVHVVTVPPAGSDPRLLWERFARVVGIDPDRFGPAPARSNQSLGVAEIELLRRVNGALDGRLAHPRFDQIVTTLYADRILASATDSPRPALPETMWPVVDKIADGWIADIAEHGYDVSGNLDDLRPPHRSGAAPDSATPEQLTDAAVRATAELLLVLAERSKKSLPQGTWARAKKRLRSK